MSAQALINMAFLPLVSARSVMSGRQVVNSSAVSNEPVRMTASTLGWVMR